MKKILKTTFIIILFFFAKNSYAQNSKFIFEAEFTPKISYRIVSDNWINKFAKPILLFDTGINLKFQLSNKNNIGTGLFYSTIGNINIFDVADIYNINIIRHYKIDYTYNYIELPVFYEHLIKKNIYIKTGLIYRRAISGKIRYKNVPDSLNGYSKEEFLKMFDATYTSRDLKDLNFNMNNLGLLLSIGQNFNISEKLYLGYGIQFKMNLLSAFKKEENRIDFYYYSAGINLKIGLK